MASTLIRGLLSQRTKRLTELAALNVNGPYRQMNALSADEPDYHPDEGLEMTKVFPNTAILTEKAK